MSQDKNPLVTEVVDEIFNELGGDRNVIKSFAEAQLQHLEQIKQQTKGYQITIRNEATSKKEEFDRVKAEHEEVQDKFGETGSDEDRIQFEQLQNELTKISTEKLMTDKFSKTMPPARALPTVSTITAKSAPTRPLPTPSTITANSAAIQKPQQPEQKNSIPTREKFVRKPRIAQGATQASQSGSEKSINSKSSQASLGAIVSRLTDERVKKAVEEALGPTALKLTPSSNIAFLEGIATTQLRDIEWLTKDLDEQNITGEKRSEMITTELKKLINEKKKDLEEGQRKTETDTQDSSYLYAVMDPLVRLKILENYLSTIPKPEKAEIVQAQTSKVEIAQARPRKHTAPPQEQAPKAPVKAVSPRAEITPQSSKSPSSRTSVEKPLPPLSEGSKLSTSPRTSARQDQHQALERPPIPARPLARKDTMPGSTDRAPSPRTSTRGAESSTPPSGSSRPTSPRSSLEIPKSPNPAPISSSTPSTGLTRTSGKPPARPSSPPSTESQRPAPPVPKRPISPSAWTGSREQSQASNTAQGKKPRTGPPTQGIEAAAKALKETKAQDDARKRAEIEKQALAAKTRELGKK